jgi:hypothetical protein
MQSPANTLDQQSAFQFYQSINIGSTLHSLNQRSATINPALSINSRHSARISISSHRHLINHQSIGISSTHSLTRSAINDQPVESAAKVSNQQSPENQHCRSAVAIFARNPAACF